MKNFPFIILLITITFFSCKKDNENNINEPTDKIFVGNLINPDNYELQDFYENEYNIIKGNVVFEKQQLINLAALGNVKRIEGSLKLNNNFNLQNLNDLKNLVEIGMDLELSRSQIPSLSGLDNLEKVGNDILLSYLPISDLNPLNKITQVNGKLTLNYLTELESLSGLDNLTEVKSQFTLFNLSISDFNNLSSLSNIGGSLNIMNINTPVNLMGLESLKYIGGEVDISNYYNIDSHLITLDGFSPDYVEGSIIIYNQTNLEDFCSLKNLFESGNFTSDWRCVENKYNPTIDDILANDCAYQEPIVLDGIYIVGNGTALSELDAKSRMHIARNEVTQEDRPTLVDKYAAVKSSSEGFYIVIVDNGEITNMGPGNDFAEVTDLDGDEPTLGLWRGSISENETPFTVPENGLYHIAYDSEIGVATISRVVWGIIGAATPGGWAESTQLTEDFNLNEMTYTINQLPLTKGDYKLRYSNGWKVILDPDYDLGDGNTGIKVNSNFGGSIDNLIPGGDNMVNDEGGYYTLEIDWSIDEGINALLYKTGDFESNDYSDTELGFVGDGMIVNGSQHNWNETVFLSIPSTINEDTYTWSFENIEVSTMGSFKIREGQTWNDMVIGYPDVTMGGSAANDFEPNFDGNFVPLVDGTYNMELIIDAFTETYTFIVNESSLTENHLYVLGDGCSAGWDNTAALEMEEISNGVFTITTELMSNGGGYIKFITELGQWTPMYGTDNDGGPYFGNLVYRETASDPDPISIPVDVAGNYIITVNINDMTYTIEVEGSKL